MISRSRLSRRNWLALLTGAVTIMVAQTGPLVRPELIAWEQNMAKMNGPHMNEAHANEAHANEAHANEAHENEPGAEAMHPYVGMWVTADGHIRHELLANGRYDEQRGTRKSAYRGRYAIIGDHIDYVDDSGFTADGDFVDGVLHHGGMVLYREQ